MNCGLGICVVRKRQGSTLHVKNQKGDATKIHKSTVGKVTPKLGALVFARYDDKGRDIRRAIITRVDDAAAMDPRRSTTVDVRFFDQSTKTLPLDDYHVVVSAEIKLLLLSFVGLLFLFSDSRCRRSRSCDHSMAKRKIFDFFTFLFFNFLVFWRFRRIFFFSFPVHFSSK